MCIAVYVATGKSFDPVSWKEDAPAFHTEDRDVEAELRARFAPLPVHYVGSHEGCGCGFQPYDDGEVDDADRRRASLGGLIAFVQKVAPADIFVCWEGQQDGDPAWEKTVSVHDAAAVDLWRVAFETAWERPCLIRVRPDEAP